MSPLPAEMRDRWANRPEPRDGEGTIYWHALLASYPKAQAAAATAQESIAIFDGFHLTPADWLHMTVLIAGSTEQLPREKLKNLLTEARSALAGTTAPTVTLQRFLYHPEAIMLAVEPNGPLQQIRRQIDHATSLITGNDIDNDATEQWVPHMTVAYSVATQPAKPIVDTLGAAIPAHEFVLNEIMLVIQWGPERQWDWEVVGGIELQRTVSPL